MFESIMRTLINCELWTIRVTARLLGPTLPPNDILCHYNLKRRPRNPFKLVTISVSEYICNYYCVFMLRECSDISSFNRVATVAHAEINL